MMMKNIMQIGVALALASGSAAAFAAPPTATLEVTGTMKVPGCEVATSGEQTGVYDFGRISPTMIKPGTAEQALNPQTQTWTVTCTGQTFLAFEVDDPMHDSASKVGIIYFGLGNINDTGKIGYYSVNLLNPKVDGDATVGLYTNARGSGAGDGAASRLMTLGAVHGWVKSSIARSDQKAGQIFAVDMTVQPYLAGSADMNGPVVDNVPLEGLLRINYSFGL